MTLDEKTKQIVLETMGCNVLKQLITVVPDFFDNDYLVAKLVPKPKEQQRPSTLVIYLEPEVVASTHPEYPAGLRVNVEGRIVDLTKQGYNIAYSPNKIRTRFNPSQELLEEGPLDGLVISEVPPTGESFGEPSIFYSYNASYGGGRKISCGTLDKDLFGISMSIMNSVHYAFVPQEKDKERELMFIDRNWELNG